MARPSRRRVDCGAVGHGDALRRRVQHDGVRPGRSVHRGRRSRGAGQKQHAVKRRVVRHVDRPEERDVAQDRPPPTGNLRGTLDALGGRREQKFLSPPQRPPLRGTGGADRGAGGGATSRCPVFVVLASRREGRANRRREGHRLPRVARAGPPPASPGRPGRSARSHTGGGACASSSARSSSRRRLRDRRVSPAARDLRERQAERERQRHVLQRPPPVGRESFPIVGERRRGRPHGRSLCRCNPQWRVEDTFLAGGELRRFRILAIDPSMGADAPDFDALCRSFVYRPRQPHAERECCHFVLTRPPRASGPRAAETRNPALAGLS